MRWSWQRMFPESGTKYGRQYDYNCGTLICRHPDAAPMQTSGLLPVGGCIPPRSVRGMRTGETGRRVYVFSYAPAEALHVSCEERRILTSCFDDLRRNSVTVRIATRDSDPAYHPAAGLYDPLLRAAVHHPEYGERSPCLGVRSLCRPLPRRRKMGDTGPLTAARCAERLQLSEAYFEDLLEQELGHTHHCHMQLRRIEIAKRKLRLSQEPLARSLRTRIPFGAIFRLSLQENDRTFPRRV